MDADFFCNILSRVEIKVAEKKIYKSVFEEILVRQLLFFIGNSRLNYWIIKSIFDMSLVYLHMLVQRCRSWQFMSPNKLVIIADRFLCYLNREQNCEDYYFG